MAKKPPSRIRYEQSHPVVSCRLDKEHYDKLKEMIGNKSLASFLKDVIDKTFIKYFNNGYDKGYKKGWDECYKKYAITVQCGICLKRFPIEANSRHHRLITKLKFMDDKCAKVDIT